MKTQTIIIYSGPQASGKTTTLNEAYAKFEGPRGYRRGNLENTVNTFSQLLLCCIDEITTQKQVDRWLNEIHANGNPNGTFLLATQAEIEESPEEYQLIKLRTDNRENQTAILKEIIAERQRQDKKFGPDRDHHPLAWLAILGEEIGEANQAALENYFGGYDSGRTWQDYRTELIQVAAVALAMVESFDKHGVSHRQL